MGFNSGFKGLTYHWTLNSELTTESLKATADLWHIDYDNTTVRLG